MEILSDDAGQEEPILSPPGFVASLRKSRLETVFGTVAVLVYVIGLLFLSIVDTMDSKATIEELGFNAGTANSKFSASWSRHAENLTQHFQRTYRETATQRLALYHLACLQTRQAFSRISSPVGGSATVRHRRLATRATCMPESREEQQALWVRLSNKTREIDGDALPPAEHPLYEVLEAVINKPFEAIVSVDWLRPSRNVGPINVHESKTETSSTNLPRANTQRRRFRLTAGPRLSSFQPTRLPFRSSSSFTRNVGFSLDGLSVTVPSARGDRRDGFMLIFAFDWDNPDEFQIAATGITLAQYLLTVPYNSRDVVFLFIDTKPPYAAGTRHFLTQYFEDASVESLAFRRGPLRGALVVEAALGSPGYSVMVEPEGPDGLLPNNDFVNFVLLESNQESLPVTLRTIWDSLVYRASNLGRHRHHVPFLERSIPALTLTWDKGRRFPSQRSLMRTLELVVRGQSNVLQSLYRSTCMYFHTDIQRQVHPTVYMFELVPFLVLLPIWALCKSHSPDAVGRSCLAFLPFPLLIGFPALLLSSSWPVATPDCRGTDVTRFSEYQQKVALWAYSSLIGSTVALVTFGFVSGNLRAQRTRQPKWRVPWKTLKSVLCFIVFYLLLILMVFHWSLAVLLTLWMSTGLLLARPLLLSTPSPGDCYISCNATRVKKCLQSLGLLCWLGITIVFVAPFGFITQPLQRTFFETLYEVAWKTGHYFRYLNVLRDLRLGLENNLPYRLGHFLRSHKNPAGSSFDALLGHPLAVWPGKAEWTEGTGVNGDSLQQVSPWYLPLFSTFRQSLNPIFVIRAYEAMQDYHCIGLVRGPILWLICLPFFVAVLALAFLTRDSERPPGDTPSDNSSSSSSLGRSAHQIA